MFAARSSQNKHITLFSRLAPPETSIICLRPVEDPTGTLLTLTIPHIDINIDNILKKRGLPRYLTGPKAPLYGKSEFISAIHFGFISGSSRIILVGNNSEQDDATDENKYLSEIISIIKKQGVEIFSTCKNSLNHRSGARFLALADIIKEEQHKYSGNGKNYIINDGYSLSQKSLFITKASDSWITDEKGKHYHIRFILITV